MLAVTYTGVLEVGKKKLTQASWIADKLAVEVVELSQASWLASCHPTYTGVLEVSWIADELAACKGFLVAELQHWIVPAF